MVELSPAFGLGVSHLVGDSAKQRVDIGIVCRRARRGRQLINQVTPIIQSVIATGASMQSLLKLAPAVLSVIALAAGAYMLWRYIQKRRRGEVLST